MLERLKEYADKIAIVHKGVAHSFGALDTEILKYCTKIDEQNILPGDIVIILGDYSFQAIALFFALYKKKAIVVPITTTVAHEVEERVRQSSVNWIWNLHDDTVSEVQENRVVERHPLLQKIRENNAAGLILFSSGSTGRPKSMVHNLDNLVNAYEGKKGKDVVFLIFLMFDHIGGLNTLLNCLATGSTMVIPETRNPEEICALIEQFKINVLPSSPTFLNLILISGAYEQYNLESLRMITYGTEPMPESLLLKLKEVFKKVKFLQTFGTSETGIVKTQSKSSSSTYLKFDDSDQEYKIVDNELWLRSKTQILGYMNYSNDSFTPDGWFKTGDLVEETEGGFIRIIGRAKELINVGGEKVLPEEVESVLLELTEVKDCLVYGIKNAITGQMVGADILPEIGTEVKDLKIKVKKHCQQKLAAYKVPVKINVVDTISYSDRFKKLRDISS